MNIRSIDLQVLIPHATDASKVQSAQNQHNNINQHHFAQQFNQIVSERREQVQKTSKTDSSKVNREKQDKDKNDGHQQDKEKDSHHRGHDLNPNEKESLDTLHSSDPLRGHIIDIKL